MGSCLMLVFGSVYLASVNVCTCNYTSCLWAMSSSLSFIITFIAYFDLLDSL